MSVVKRGVEVVLSDEDIAYQNSFHALIDRLLKENLDRYNKQEWAKILTGDDSETVRADP